jgi:hypothetical protein
MRMERKVYQIVLITAILSLSFCGDADDDLVEINLLGY